MPIKIEEGKSPKGTRLMVARVQGNVTLAEAEAMGKLLQPGQAFEQATVLSIVASDTVYEPAARRHFQSFNGHFRKMGTVVTNPLVRAAINFMLHVTGRRNAMKLFNTEAEALAWLDASE